MRTLFPAASAFLVVALISSVSYAESLLVSKSSDVATSANEGGSSEATSTERRMADRKELHSRKELSVAPLTHTTFPDDRPSWIDQTTSSETESHRRVVVTRGHESIEKCESELMALRRAAVALYVEETTGTECPDSLIDDQWIEDELISKRYVGSLEQGDFELHEIAIELFFDEQDRSRIARTLQNATVCERLKATGGIFAIGLIGLCCTGGLLGFVGRRYA